MISVAKLRRKPRHLQAFTGLSLAEFDCVLDHVTAAYEAAEATRHHAPLRHLAADAPKNKTDKDKTDERVKFPRCQGALGQRL